MEVSIIKAGFRYLAFGGSRIDSDHFCIESNTFSNHTMTKEITEIYKLIFEVQKSMKGLKLSVTRDVTKVIPLLGH